MTGLARSRSGADTNGCARMVLVTSACRVSQLQEVVDGADHRPFASDLVEAPQQELPKASGMFDLPEHRLNNLFAQPVAAAAADRLSLVAMAALRDPCGHCREPAACFAPWRARPGARYAEMRRRARWARLASSQ